MFDYYAMPANVPGIDYRSADLYVCIGKVEETVIRDIGQSNCKFHFMLHEFEGILFSNPLSFQKIAGETAVHPIQMIRDSFPTPEQISNSPVAVPSKRVGDAYTHYAKFRYGTIYPKIWSLMLY